MFQTPRLISLSSVGKLSVLKDLFGEVVISEAVYNEIKAKRRYGYDEIETNFIKVETITGTIYRDCLLNQLDFGEAETIILAKEKNADLVLIDENIGYKIARNAGLEVVRTLSVLLKVKEKGIIQNLNLLDDMIEKDRWYLNNIYENFLKRAVEL